MSETYGPPNPNQEETSRIPTEYERRQAKDAARGAADAGTAVTVGGVGGQEYDGHGPPPPRGGVGAKVEGRF